VELKFLVAARVASAFAPHGQADHGVSEGLERTHDVPVPNTCRKCHDWSVRTGQAHRVAGLENR